jgi:hypothetical protein
MGNLLYKGSYVGENNKLTVAYQVSSNKDRHTFGVRFLNFTAYAGVGIHALGLSTFTPIASI